MSSSENLIKASSGQEALEYLLKSEVAVVLMDVCMPDLDGFQLAAMIREHPRFQKTAMIFISAIHLTDMDRLRGYEMGAVDYVPVPVIPEVLRAKVKIFVELYRKTRQLERMNAELEERVSARTAELEASTAQLRQSEESRSLALAAGNMGSWDWDRDTGDCLWDDGQYGIFGVNRKHFGVTAENVRALIHPEDWQRLQSGLELLLKDRKPIQNEFRVKRPNGEVRWCIGTAAPSIDDSGRVARISGVTVDITDRKIAEERQALLAREVDHRAKNALALVQSIVRLTRASDIAAYTDGGGRADQGAVAGAHHPVAVALAGRGYPRPRRGGTRALPDRRNGQGRNIGTERIAAAGGGAIARAGAARTRDQRRQIRRAVLDVGARAPRLGAQPRHAGACGGRKAAARRRRRRRRRASGRGSSPPASKDSLPARPCSTGVRKGCNACCRFRARTWRR